MNKLFLISYGIFAHDDYGMFMTNNGINTPTNIELSNSIVDEVHIKQDVDLDYTTDKDAWLPSTVGIAKFQDDLHYGNFSLAGLEITHLKFKKRKSNTNKWITFKVIPFDKNVTTYEVIDRLIEADEEYVYGVSPATATIEGDIKQITITAEFDGMYISDKDNYYRLIYNYELGDILHNAPSAIIETLDNPLPTIMYSASNFKQGSIRCMLISDNTVNAYGAIDKKTEKALRNQIMSFLTNKKPKLLKDSSGNFIGVQIIGTPTLSPHNELGQQIYDLSFEFIETVDLSDENMLKYSGII